ncbi:hypothetical protein HGH92_24590 [Chitinophaga varians]|uniref:Uncharacterized protein n=1 Tax=Chitinophaga varians TaxID=2202339 RepID=A0A847RXG8_9BACT|nr:hypothetical protein [Chitinophaga varians]NLR67506.1 hypothetical protein [Chitinophaga varians]
MFQPTTLWNMLKQPWCFLLLFVMMPFAGKAQTDSAAYIEFQKAIRQAPRFSTTFQQNGRPFELALVCEVSHGEKTVRYIPGEVPDSIYEYFSPPVRVLMQTDWAKIFPSLSVKGDFSVVVPFVVRFENDPPVTVKQEMAILQRLFGYMTSLALPYRVCDPVFVNFRRKEHHKTDEVTRL